MTFFGAALLTAAATAVLAFFAIVTAWYARKAFLKQSQEVRAIEQQVSDQKELTAKQAGLLEVQADQLGLQQQQFDQQQEDRRLDQASRVFMWTEAGPNPAIGQVQRVTTPGAYEVVTVHVKNTSEQPVYDLTINWRKGTAPWGAPDRPHGPHARSAAGLHPRPPGQPAPQRRPLALWRRRHLPRPQPGVVAHPPGRENSKSSRPAANHRTAGRSVLRRITNASGSPGLLSRLSCGAAG
jgi:hypothetical protein